MFDPCTSSFHFKRFAGTFSLSWQIGHPLNPMRSLRQSTVRWLAELGVSGVHGRSDCWRGFLEASIGRAWGWSGTHSSVSSRWPVAPRVHGNLRNHKLKRLLNTLLLASVFLSFKSGIWCLVLGPRLYQPVSSSRPA